MIAYKMQNIVIKICDHTLPLAAKFNAVTPMQVATKVRRSIFPVMIFERITAASEPSHSVQ